MLELRFAIAKRDCSKNRKLATTKLTLKTGDVRYIEKAEKEILKAAVGFAMWLQKQALGVQSDSATEQDSVNQQQEKKQD